MATMCPAKPRGGVHQALCEDYQRIQVNSRPIYFREFQDKVQQFLPVCVDAAWYRSSHSEGVDAIPGQQAAWPPHIHHGRAFVLGDELLYYGPHTGCAFVLKYYHL
jgi:hypothetical protein